MHRALPVKQPCCPRDLADNHLDGGLPDQWALGMDSLRAANLTNNSIAGALPDQWANLTSLQAL